MRAFIRKHMDILSYLFFGVLTTLVNYLVYLPCYNLLGISATVSNILAWAVSVVFAFLTNKPFVFKSHDWSPSVAGLEFAKFVFCRVGSGAMESLAIFVTVDLLRWDGNVMKLILSVAVVILNYVGSKLLVFRQKNRNSGPQ